MPEGEKWIKVKESRRGGMLKRAASASPLRKGESDDSGNNYLTMNLRLE